MWNLSLVNSSSSLVKIRHKNNKFAKPTTLWEMGVHFIWLEIWKNLMSYILSFSIEIEPRRGHQIPNPIENSTRNQA